jgi:hypothetical protein
MDDVVFLRGAAAIARELQRIGLLPADHPDPKGATYHLVRSKQIDVDRFGRTLITTPAKLRQTINRQIS